MQYVSRNWQDKEKQMRHELLNLSKTEIDSMINEYIVGRNAERNRRILHRRLIDGICYEPLAEEFDLSTKQIQNICYEGIKRLLKRL